MKIVISSGHGLYVRGASGYLDEVKEARNVAHRVAALLQSAGVTTVEFDDNTSTTQSQNLNTIVNFHNAQGPHDLDVSVHFNAFETNDKPMGSEVCWVSQQALASKVSAALATALQLPNRGAKQRTGLAFLNGTKAPAILIEVCFVDSSVDADHYHKYFEQACTAIAETIGNVQITAPPPDQPPPVATAPLASFKGKVSWFGGPDDKGVSPSEGLAFIYSYDARPDLFLPKQPPGTTGLARRLNPDVFYIACRWDYAKTPKAMLAEKSKQALVTANGRSFMAWPSDWGPHKDTGRVADISPGLMKALGIKTDDVVEVLYPAPAPMVA